MSSRRDVLAGLVGAGVVEATLLATDASAQPASPTLARPARGGLTVQEIRRILDQGEAAANGTTSQLRTVNGNPQFTRMHIAVVARDGRFCGIRSMEDAWVGSEDIAIAKARTAAFFSSNQNALTSRTIGELSQAHGADGTGPAGPLWGIWASNQIGITGTAQTRNGLITFPGGVPLYKNGVLVGGVGVSGDGVDPDEIVAFAAAVGFEPPSNIARVGFPNDM